MDICFCSGDTVSVRVGESARLAKKKDRVNERKIVRGDPAPLRRISSSLSPSLRGSSPSPLSSSLGSEREGRGRTDDGRNTRNTCSQSHLRSSPGEEGNRNHPSSPPPPRPPPPSHPLRLTQAQGAFSLADGSIHLSTLALTTDS